MKKLLLLVVALVAYSVLSAQSGKLQTANEVTIPATAQKPLLAPGFSSFKSTLDCDSFTVDRDSFFIEHINRIQTDPNNQILLITPLDSSSFIPPAQPGGDTTFFTTVAVAQSIPMDVSTLDLDSLSIYRLEGDVNFIFVGDEDSVEFRILTGTEVPQQQNTVYPTSLVQSFQVLPSNFWDPVPNRPDFNVGGINLFPLDVPNPENLLDNANFFNNNTVFISVTNNDTAKDDSVFYVTGTENTGGGNNRLFYEQLRTSDNSVSWINSVLNFDQASETNADLYLIPYFALVKCAEDTSTSRDESISYGDLTMYNIYPNPVQNQVSVAFEMNTASDFTIVEIIDNNGRVVFETELGALLPDMKHTHTFDVGHLASGMYSVKLTTNNGGMGLRMVKQ